MSRRQFLTRTATTAMAASAVPVFSINVLGANEKIRVAAMGCGGRGRALIQWFAERDDVEIACLADPDMRRVQACAKDLDKKGIAAPKLTQDFRDALNDPEVDALINATPDHWHALGTILACQAGKDVYVEKPASHSIWEGRKMVEAARKYGRIVQLGTQCRSAPYLYQAKEHLQSPDFGDIHFVRVLNSKQRGTIGKEPDKETPEGVNYDMWLGPAPSRPFNENHFHYAWHWFWNYSGGDIINDGVHQIDLARFLAGVTYPKSVVSGGGIYYFNDDQETPDTHTVTWDFDTMAISFEQALWAPYLKKTALEVRDTDPLPDWPFNGTRVEVYGTKQFMFFGRHGDGWQVFDADGKPVRGETAPFSPANYAHIDNFIQCMRTREKPAADIEEGHLSTLLCQYGNIAYRTNQKLYIDPKTEGFIDNDAANALVKRTYREPWAVPEEV